MIYRGERIRKRDSEGEIKRERERANFTVITRGKLPDVDNFYLQEKKVLGEIFYIAFPLD